MQEGHHKKSVSNLIKPNLTRKINQSPLPQKIQLKHIIEKTGINTPNGSQTELMKSRTHMKSQIINTSHTGGPMF